MERKADILRCHPDPETGGGIREATKYDAVELLRRLLLSVGFEIFIGACIIINTIVLAIEHPFIDADIGVALCICNVVSSTRLHMSIR